MPDKKANTPAHNNRTRQHPASAYTDAEAEASKEAWLEQMADQLEAEHHYQR